MTRRTRKTAKPKSPAQIAAEKLAKRANDLAAVGMAPDAAFLQNHEAVQVVRAGEHRDDGKRVDNDVARRLDAFEALRPSMQRGEFAGAYDAARRFERDVLMSLGQHDHGRHPDKVDCDPSAGDRTDAIVAASERVKRIRDRLPDRDAWLLCELIAPKTPGEEWRQIVARITAETNWNAQGACVRHACVNLREVYEKQDVVSRRAA